MNLVGYIRVSRVGGREGDSFISPDVQRERIESYAAANGHTVSVFETDLDVSGGTMRRPGYERAMRAIESGRAEGLIVAKLDRFSRTLDGALAAVRQLDAAGAVLVSCADQLDASTPTGKAMFRMLLVIAELQRDMIKASWNEATVKAVARGVHISSHVPVGYLLGDDGRLVPDPATAPLVIEAFERRASGGSWVDVCKLLDLTRQGIRQVVANRVYLGEARHGAIVNADAHEPLVSRELWETANVARGLNRPRKAIHLLGGIARCATCRHAMSAGGSGAYRCGNGRCTGRAGINAEPLEANVRALYAMFVATPAAVEAERAGELREALDEAEANMRAFVTIVNATEPGFREGLDARQAVVAEARRQLAAVASPQLVALDPDEPIVEQRRKLSQAIVAVFIRPGRGSLVDRTRIVWNGSTVELPTRGARRTLPPFPFGDHATLSLVVDRQQAEVNDADRNSQDRRTA